MRSTASLKIFIALALPLLLAVACDSSGTTTKCTDIKVAEGCALRCTRVAIEADKKKICGKSLMLTGDSSNNILQRKTKRIEFRSLPGEQCFEVTAEGKMVSAAKQQDLVKFCGNGTTPASQPAGY